LEYLIGTLVAVAVVVFAKLSGFDRERVFYPAVLIVTATYYILFAAIGNSVQALSIESGVAGVFAALAVLGFKKSFWLIPAGFAGHGAFDLVHSSIVQNPGTPIWWPGFCMSFDVIAGILVAVLLVRRSGFQAEKLPAGARIRRES